MIVISWEPIMSPDDTKQRAMKKIHRALEQSNATLAHNLAIELYARKYLLSPVEKIVISIAITGGGSTDEEEVTAARRLWHEGSTLLTRKRRFHVHARYAIELSLCYLEVGNTRLMFLALLDARGSILRFSEANSVIEMRYENMVQRYFTATNNLEHLNLLSLS